MGTGRTPPDEESRDVFRAADFGVVRMAALPRTHPSMARTLTTGQEPGGPPSPAGGPESAGHLASYVTDVAADPVVREALDASSASLAGTLTKLEAGVAVPAARLRRAALAVTRYVVRMTSRPTPFGLLAGVGTARFGDRPAVRIGTAHRRHARPDAAWLDDIVARLHHDPALRDGLLVVTNNLCFRRGDRLVLPYVRAGRDTPAEQPVPHEMTIGNGPVVEAAVEAARQPLPFAELRAALRARFPQARAEDVDRLLTGLIDREVLLTDVRARQDHPDQLSYVNRRLLRAGSGGEEPSPLARGLRRVEERLAAYSAAAPGAGRTAWHAALDTMREAYTLATGGAPTGTRPPVHVDLRTDSDVRLPGTVRDEVARAAGVLWRLAPADGQYPQLTEYHRAFLDRYGTERPVPVREVLDAHRGLGAPAGYRVPAGDRGGDSAPATPYPAARDEALGEALHEVLVSGPGAELVLDQSLIERLAPREAGAALPPGTLDLCVQPLARSVAALAEGDFRLLVSNGSYSAGAMAGRFAAALGLEAELTDLHRQAPGDGGTGPEPPLPVQLFFQPRDARSANVARVPRLTGHVVFAGCFPDPEAGPADIVALDELAVAADGERLFLVQAATGREVTILRPSMLNIVTEAPNLARFLAGIGTSGLRPWAPWQWSRLEALPCLPRVRYGRTILAPARWRPPPALRDPSLDGKEWVRALEQWRSRCHVPRVLRVSVLDHHLDLDVTAPAHQEVLRGQLRGRHASLVQESPLSDPELLGWSAGHVTEVVVPLLPVRPRPAAPRTPAPATARVRHAPGGEWLYAKLYAARDRLDTLLVRDLPPLLERVGTDMDRWFFLRYLDPAPHLRLRLHGAPDALRERVLTALHEWAQAAMAEGRLRKLVLDTYEPETERYGGSAALPWAERLFHADSRLVAAQLAARAHGDGGPPVPLETLAALDHAALLDALGDWDWWTWVRTACPPEAEHEVPAARRRAAVRLAGRQGGADDALSAERAGLARAARDYGRALGIGTQGPSAERGAAVAGILHMHANRLLGLDPAAERHAFGILRSMVRAFEGRARHT